MGAVELGPLLQQHVGLRRERVSFFLGGQSFKMSRPAEEAVSRCRESVRMIAHVKMQYAWGPYSSFEHVLNFGMVILFSPSSSQAIGQPSYVPQNTTKNFQSRGNFRTVTNLAAAQVKTADSSAPGGAYTPNGTSSMNLMTSAVNALFSYQVRHSYAAKVHLRYK